MLHVSTMHFVKVNGKGSDSLFHFEGVWECSFRQMASPCLGTASICLQDEVGFVASYSSRWNWYPFVVYHTVTLY